MRNKTVKFGGKKVRVEEKRIGELEKLVVELFPDSKGDISKIQISSLLDQAGFGLLYEKIPVIFPDVTDEDVKNAYMSELEELIGAFLDVNFTGLRRMLGPLLGLAQAGLRQTS